MDDVLLMVFGAPWVMLLLGALGNFLAAAAQASHERGHVVGPVSFVCKRPYRVSLGLLSSLAAYVILAASDEATAASAFAVGYAGSDVVQRMAEATTNKMTRKI